MNNGIKYSEEMLEEKKFSIGSCSSLYNWVELCTCFDWFPCTNELMEDRRMEEIIDNFCFFIIQIR